VPEVAQKVIVEDATFLGQKIVFTGFRDAKLEAFIKERGGEVSSGVSKSTTLVIKKDSEETSSKLTRAKELGITIVNLSDFVKKHNV
jgi:NAD-dependent DNA ligase